MDNEDVKILTGCFLVFIILYLIHWGLLITFSLFLTALFYTLMKAEKIVIEAINKLEEDAYKDKITEYFKSQCNIILAEIFIKTELEYSVKNYSILEIENTKDGNNPRYKINYGGGRTRKKKKPKEAKTFWLKPLAPLGA